jgi:outer membrane protein assembly factor BamA
MFKKNPLNLLENFSLDKDGFEIMPLTFFNMLFTNISRKTIFKNARTSAGLGVSVMSKLFSFEILYTPYVHLHKGDIHAKFHLKFGID